MPGWKIKLDGGYIMRVLLVEDNPVNQIVARRFVERRGHEVVVAGNGMEALKLIGAGSFDLALMDLQMPEMDGYEATAAIRRNEGDERRLIIVAMTAHVSEEDAEECLRAGMDGYLAKPVRLDELARILREAETGAIRERTGARQGFTTPPRDGSRHQVPFAGVSASPGRFPISAEAARYRPANTALGRAGSVPRPR